MPKALKAYSLVASFVALTASTGCPAGICARPEKAEPTKFTGGEVIGDTYRTSDFDGDLLHFPGGAFYEIHHGLGERPVGVSFYLSFERDGLTSASVSQAAGNQVELKSMDETSITVLNGTCADFFLIVQAFRSRQGSGAGGGVGAGGTSGAGGSGGS